MANSSSSSSSRLTQSGFASSLATERKGEAKTTTPAPAQAVRLFKCKHCGEMCNDRERGDYCREPRHSGTFYITLYFTYLSSCP